MKIGTKLTLSLATPLVALVALFGYLYQWRSRTLLQQELAREGRALARTVQLAVEDYSRDDRLDDLHELVDRITGYEKVLGLRVFNPDGQVSYQSASLELHQFRDHGALRQVLLERKAIELREVVGREPVISFIFPVSRPDGDLRGAVQVLKVESFVDEARTVLVNSILTLTAIMILATGAIVLIVTRFGISRPIQELARRFREVGSGNLRGRVPVRRRDEFGRLAQEFNQMCERLDETQTRLLSEQAERLRMEVRLRSAERLAGLGRLAAGLAHEIGTPLNIIGGRAEQLRRRLSGNELAGNNLRIITTEIDRIVRIVRGMLDFASERDPQPASAQASRPSATDLSSVIRNVLELLDGQLRQAGVRAESGLPGAPLLVSASADDLTQVFLNLAVNAVDAMPGGGILRVGFARVERLHPEQGGAMSLWLSIWMEDTGGGIAPEHEDRVFDPFFSTKAVGKGTGLGLSIAYGIARRLGGWIDAKSEVGKGTRVTLYLPPAGRSVAPAAVRLETPR